MCHTIATWEYIYHIYVCISNKNHLKCSINGVERDRLTHINRLSSNTNHTYKLKLETKPTIVDRQSLTQKKQWQTQCSWDS